MIDEPTFLTLHDPVTGLLLGRDTALSVGRDTSVVFPAPSELVVLQESSELTLERSSALSLSDPGTSLALADKETALEAERELLLTLDG